MDLWSSYYAFRTMLLITFYVLQRTGLVKLRRVLRAIRKHFPQPPDNVLAGNAIDKILDDPDLCEDKLSEEAGTDGFLDSVIKMVFSDPGSFKQQQASLVARYCHFTKFIF